MNEMNVMSTRTTGRVQAIDEIAFHTSILALQAAVEAGGEACPVAGWSARAASDTLALIEQSLNYSPQTEPGDAPQPVAVRRTAAHPYPEDEEKALRRMAERIRGVRDARPFGEPR